MEHTKILRNKVGYDYNSLKETFRDRENNSKQEVKQWEDDLIEKIKQISQQRTQQLTESFHQINNQMTDICEKLKEEEKKEEVDETQLIEIGKQLASQQQKLNDIDEILIELKSVTVIQTRHEAQELVLHSNMKWKSHGITVVGKNGQGNQLNQLSKPHCMFINDDDDQTIYVADYGNDRIVEWKPNTTNGQIITHGNGQEITVDTCELKGLSYVVIHKRTNQFIIADPGNRRLLRRSRENSASNEETIISDIVCWGLGIDKDGSLYTCDVEKNEVKRWNIGQTIEGTLVAGGNRNGDKLNQLHWATSVFIDDNYSLYIADMFNHRIVKWQKNAQEGIVVAGGNGNGESFNQLNKPEGVLVDKSGRIYVADTYNHRIIRWCPGSTEGEIILGTGIEGSEPNRLKGPTRLCFDQQRNLYVVDSWKHRIQKFERIE